MIRLSDNSKIRRIPSLGSLQGICKKQYKIRQGQKCNIEIIFRKSEGRNRENPKETSPDNPHTLREEISDDI